MIALHLVGLHVRGHWTVLLDTLVTQDIAVTFVIKALKVPRDGACGMLVVVGRGVNYIMAFKIDIAIQY